MYARSTRRRRFLCGWTAFLFFMVSLLSPAAALENGGTRSGMVRVNLSSMGSPSRVDVTLSGSYSAGGQALSGGGAVTVQLNASDGTLTLTQGGVRYASGTTVQLRRHTATGENGVRIAQSLAPGNLYPGDLTFQSYLSGGTYKMRVIAYIFIEDYLYGVLPYEMGNSSPLEALKAQAVSARTYTLRAMQNSASRGWDVVDTTSDQVYRGTPSGNANCRTAVDTTKGVVSMNGSALTATYYTASNGGQIESVKNLWGSTAYNYITVKDDPYDLQNPDSRVRSFWVTANGAQSNATLGRLLNDKAVALFGAGAQVTAVSAITPHTPKYPAPSRLYTKLDFAVTVSANGSSCPATLTFDIFSELETPLSMSLNSMKNELWTVAAADGGFRVEARRWGHGTGLSQRGAMQMAKQGFTYDQILSFYFEGCRPVQYAFTRSILSPISDGSQEIIIIETPLPGGDASPAPAGLTARVTTVSGSLNLRASASGSARVLRTIPRNEIITVSAPENGWCRTVYQGTEGYVMSSFLTFLNAPTPTPGASTPTPAPDAPSGDVYARVTTVSGSLNLRAQARDTARVLRTIPRGKDVQVLSRGDSWCQVTYEGTVGFVMTRFLTFASSPSPTASAPTLTPAPDVPSGSVYARVTTVSGSLNLRTAPSAYAAVLRTIPRNEVILIEEMGTVWCRTSYQGTQGYVMTSFLTLGVPAPDHTPAPADPPAGEGLRARVTTVSGSLNLRDRASSYGSILRTIPQNEEITVSQRGDVWCEVTYLGTSGYVMTRFLTFLNGDVSSPSPTPTLSPSPDVPAPSPTAAPAPSSSPTDIPTPSPAPAETDAPTPTEEAQVILSPLNPPRLALIQSESDSLNLREGASTSARILCEMPRGDYLLVTAMNDMWCRVEYEGKSGFCMRKYLVMPDEQ